MVTGEKIPEKYIKKVEEKKKSDKLMPAMDFDSQGPEKTDDPDEPDEDKNEPPFDPAEEAKVAKGKPTKEEPKKVETTSKKEAAKKEEPVKDSAIKRVMDSFKTNSSADNSPVKVDDSVKSSGSIARTMKELRGGK